MVKSLKSFRLLILLGIGLAALGGCAGAGGVKPAFEPATPLRQVPSVERIEAQRVSSRNLQALVSELNVAADGSAVLVSTIPNPEIAGGSAAGFVVRKLNRSGAEVWRHRFGSAVRAQAIATNGKTAAVATYDETLTLFNSRGKPLWTVEGVCSPVILTAIRTVLCYHDDDAEPQVAFEAYSWEGRKLLSYPIQDDILALKKSPDDRLVALALTRGQVVLIGSDLRALWQSAVKGEVVDLAVSRAPQARVAVLTAGGEMLIYDFTGQVIARGSARRQVQQIEISADGLSVAVQTGGGPSNSVRTGQYLALFEVDALRGELVEKASYSSPRSSDFAPQMTFTPAGLFVGLDDLVERPGGSPLRRSRVVLLTSGGESRAELSPPQDDDLLYLHDAGLSSGEGLAVLATDVGDLLIYRLQSRR